MSNDMKLIMESWRNSVIKEALPDCESSQLKIGHFEMAYTAATKKMNASQIKQQYGDKAGQSLAWVLAIAGLLGEFKLAGAVGAVASGGTGALAGIAVGATVAAIKFFRGKKARKKSIDALLKALCVDPNLLVVLDDDVEDQFLESDVFKAFRADIAQRNSMDDLPDLNKVFVKFIEDKKLALGNQKTTIQPK
jgi:hypothetical protein